MAPGRVNTRRASEGRPSKPQAEMTPLTPEALAFFIKRGLSFSTLERNRVAMSRIFCHSTGSLRDAFAFPYYRNGELINVKYRFVGAKEFTQVNVAGCAN